MLKTVFTQSLQYILYTPTWQLGINEYFYNLGVPRVPQNTYHVHAEHCQQIVLYTEFSTAMSMQRYHTYIPQTKGKADSYNYMCNQPAVCVNTINQP